MTNPPADSPAAAAADGQPEDGVSWREMAVARSLDSARTRAENRVQRFMAAAMELITTNEGKDFTVQEVVERSGQSLRSFYQHFDGKHELLLALFEESVVSTTAYLTERIGDEADPLERIHRFVVEYHAACRPPSPGRTPPKGVPPAMAEFAQQLLTQHPKEAARAFGPLVSMFRDLLEEATAAGVVRPGLPDRRVAGVVLEAVMFNVFSSTIGGASTRGDDRDAAEELWDLLAHGIVGTPG
ncbi:MAG TPA: TetR/AcrR family transcriptional regulator [Acidimicrobiales bacterium]|nr:TetR/AcrR family transcriptional regulator [Acidimicrobiales bacterium]